MNRSDTFILECSSFEEFLNRASRLDTKEKGDHTERLAQVYLQTQPEYQSALKQVWLWKDVPDQLLEELGLPRKDLGIDLLAEHSDGTYWAIQAKYRTDQEQALGWEILATFLAASAQRQISCRVVFHTTARPIGNRQYMPKLFEIGLAQLYSANWELIQQTIKTGIPARPAPKQPLAAWRQDEAVAAALAHFAEHDRGRLLMPCGTGKGLLQFFISAALDAKKTIVAVPSLNLLKQSVRVWMQEYAARELTPTAFCVASDESVGECDPDAFVEDCYNLGLRTSTDVQQIANWLRQPNEHKLVFTTYHSSKVLAEAARLAGVEFDLIICDEAHRTVGARNRAYATLLHDHAIKARYRLFMTATERTFRMINGHEDEMLSMDDDAEHYGPRFFEMSVKQAIELGIICDYKILTYVVSEAEIAALIEANRLLNVGRKLEEVEARDAAGAVALKRVMQEYGATHPVVYTASLKRAEEFCAMLDELNRLNIGPVTKNLHVNGNIPAGEREQILRKFITALYAVVTNVRCLTEGQDVPGIDAVMFARPKQSITDIVQASGRALRTAPGKKLAYIVVPLVVPEGLTLEEFTENTAFQKVVSIITALASKDERIVEELKARFNGTLPKKPWERIVDIGGKPELVGLTFSLTKLADAIETRLSQRVARLAWRSFEEAREFARSLSLESMERWFDYCRNSSKKPLDIPTSPYAVYVDKGWVGWPDFLGSTKYRRNNDDWLPFEEARARVRKEGFCSRRAFTNWKEKPCNIPPHPHSTYTDKGWIDWADFLGSDHLGANKYRHAKWLPYAEASAIVCAEGFPSAKEFKAWKQRPANIPSNPNKAYAYRDKGWVNWSEFLGTNRKGRRTSPKPKCTRLTRHRRRRYY